MVFEVSARQLIREMKTPLEGWEQEITRLTRRVAFEKNETEGGSLAR